MLSESDLVFLLGLAHWIVYTIRAVEKETAEEKNNDYICSYLGFLVAVGAIIYKFWE